jgi:hypothetical protein
MLFLLLRAVLAGVWTAPLVLQTVKTDFFVLQYHSYWVSFIRPRCMTIVKHITKHLFQIPVDTSTFLTLQPRLDLTEL